MSARAELHKDIARSYERLEQLEQRIRVCDATVLERAELEQQRRALEESIRELMRQASPPTPARN